MNRRAQSRSAFARSGPIGHCGRVRWWRIVLVVVVTAVAGAGTLLAVRSRDSSPRVATAKEFRGLRVVSEEAWKYALSIGQPEAGSARIVATQRHSAFGRGIGPYDAARDPAVYLVQMLGRFLCVRCGERPTARYRVLSMIFDVKTLLMSDDGVTDRAANLSLMGRVYRLPPDRLR